MTLRQLWLMSLRRFRPYLAFSALWAALAAIFGIGLLGFFVGEVVLLLVVLVAEIGRRGRLGKSKGQARAIARLRRPPVPWGLDLVSVMAGLAIGFATEWWIGVVAWVLFTALLWAGWTWTRRFVRPDDPSSPRIDRFLDLAIWALMGGLWVTVLIQATVEWGDVGFLATALGLGAYAFLLERFVRLHERDRPAE